MTLTIVSALCTREVTECMRSVALFYFSMYFKQAAAVPFGNLRQGHASTGDNCFVRN